MPIKLRSVDAAEKARLRGMLSAYLQELNQYGDVDLNYCFFDSYWTDRDRWAYFIETEDGVAGFFLVNTWSPSGKGADFALAECYLLPAFRGTGNGKNAFSRLLQSRPGVWELSVMSRNLPAKAFWQRTLATLCVGEVERIEFEARISRSSAHRADPYVATLRASRARMIDMRMAAAMARKPPDTAMMPPSTKIAGA